MENYNQTYGQNQPEKTLFNNLEIDQIGKINLAEAAKWAKFMGIIGMIMLVLMILGALVFMTIGSDMFSTASPVPGMGFGAGFIGIIYLVVAGLYFYPTWTLLKFGTQTRLGIKNENQAQFNDGLRNLKNCFKFVGILTVIIIAIYVLAIIAVAVGAGMGAMR